MFFGEYGHTVDDKGRITIPSRLRPALAAGLVITRGFERCLYIYPIARWEELAQKIRQFPILSDDEVGDFVRFLFAKAIDYIPDKQGRVLIPTNLREYAHLDTEVIVAGVMDHLEVWNPEAYRQKNATMEENPKAFARGLSQFGMI